MKKERLMVDAIFTLEMSVVFPVVFMAIIGNIVFCFYIHDSAKMQACAYSAGVESAYTGNDIEDSAYSEREKMISLCVDDVTSSCESSTIKYTGNVRTMQGVFDYFGKGKVVESKRFVPKMKRANMYIFKTAKDLLEENIEKKEGK